MESKNEVVPGITNMREWAVKASVEAEEKKKVEDAEKCRKHLKDLLKKHLGLVVEPEGKTISINGVEFSAKSGYLTVINPHENSYYSGCPIHKTGDEAWVELGDAIRKIAKDAEEAAKPKPAAPAPSAEKQLTAEERLLKALRVIIADEMDANA